jgi:hypothetical protein
MCTCARLKCLNTRARTETILLKTASAEILCYRPRSRRNEKRKKAIGDKTWERQTAGTVDRVDGGLSPKNNFDCDEL